MNGVLTARRQSLVSLVRDVRGDALRGEAGHYIPNGINPLTVYHARRHLVFATEILTELGRGVHLDKISKLAPGILHVDCGLMDLRA